MTKKWCKKELHLTFFLFIINNLLSVGLKFYNSLIKKAKLIFIESNEHLANAFKNIKNA